MKVLITGAAGFIGSYLTQHCTAMGDEVLGIDVRGPESAWTSGEFEHCDIRNSSVLSKLISTFQPTHIFHLAAQSHPMVSIERPFETMDTNAGGTINLFESVRTARFRPVVVIACSSAEYGLVLDQDLPVREEHALRPIHPYGVSKVAQDLLAAQYFWNFSIPTIRIRIFKTTGPGKLGDVCSDLAKRAVEIQMGVRPPSMQVGNLMSRRSIVDVRDLVQALRLSVEHCEIGEVYNLGGDDVYSVQEVIEAIRTQMTVPFEIKQRPELMRSCDEPITVGDNAKFRRCCAWVPKITLSETLQDMLGWWSTRITGSLHSTSQKA
jgi:nucleoside-diphosphate-sugar epimerase